MTRGSPAGSLNKKHFVHNSRSEANIAAAVNAGLIQPDRKVSRMQMGKYFVHFNQIQSQNLVEPSQNFYAIQMYIGSQNTVEIQSKCSRNTFELFIVEIQSKYSRNTVEIQSKYSRNTVKIQSKYNQKSCQKSSQNTVKIQKYPKISSLTKVISKAH